MIHLSVVLFPLAAAMSGDVAGDFIRGSFVHRGAERVYYLHLPRGTMPSRPVPLLFILHGGDGGSARMMASYTGCNRISDREDFISVYPRGLGGQWNDGRGSSFRMRDNSGVDDTGFISSLLDRLGEEFPVDMRRVYVTGVSNGGMMTYRLGLELGDRLAAIAPVISALPANLLYSKPLRPIPILVMNGTEDPLIPWKGGHVQLMGKKFGRVLSTMETVSFWVRSNGVGGEPSVKVLPDLDPRDGCRVEVSSYGQGSPYPVILYTVRGGGHHLPGSRTLARYIMLGRKCMDISGAETIWNFLKEHSLPSDEK